MEIEKILRVIFIVVCGYILIYTGIAILIRFYQSARDEIADIKRVAPKVKVDSNYLDASAICMIICCGILYGIIADRILDIDFVANYVDSEQHIVVLDHFTINQREGGYLLLMAIFSLIGFYSALLRVGVIKDEDRH